MTLILRQSISVYLLTNIYCLRMRNGAAVRFRTLLFRDKKAHNWAINVFRTHTHTDKPE